MMPKKGDVLRTATTTYTVGDSCGSGGAGQVFKAIEGGRTVAIKVLRNNADNQKLKRFKSELDFLFREDHPHIIKVFDFGLTNSGEPFYVMPFASGTLRTLMRDGIAEASALSLFSQLLDGVEAAHLKGVFHRDLKPENILWESGVLKVADFGIAGFEEDALFRAAANTEPGERLANWQYAAPEQRALNGKGDSRADLYALGLILVEMFTDEVPHGLGGKTIGAAAPNLAYLDDLVMTLRRQNPEDRPQSVREVKHELITRGNAFISQQKFDQLRRVVVKDEEVTDPLALDPPYLEHVEFRDSFLEFRLSKPLTPKWITTFQNAPLGGLMGYGPERHTFQGKSVKVGANPQLAQQLIDQFQHYLAEVNKTYFHNAKMEEKKRVLTEQQNKAAQLEREASRLAVQNRLKW